MPESSSPRVRIWLPVALSLLVQLATTGAVLALHGAHWRGPRPFPGQPSWGVPNPVPGAGAQPVHGWVVVVLFGLAVVGPALLAVIRSRPGPVAALVTFAAVAGTVVSASQGYGAAFYLSAVFAVGAAVFLRARTWAWISAGAYWLTFATAYLFSDPSELGWLVPLTILSVGALVGPEFARSRREARARLVREAEARRAEEAQAERVRIARELHDVLAHSLSQINVQASVGLHLFDAHPEGARAALASIKGSSKQALGEVRQVLGMLRGDAPLAPEPGLDDLAGLVERLARNGVSWGLSTTGVDLALVPSAVQQAVYRIVQEAVTNVVKHAHAHSVTVVVSTSDGRLVVRVVDDGVGAASPPSPSPHGRGLLGMRERAELLGGTFAAGPRDSGGFVVEARLPLGGRT